MFFLGCKIDNVLYQLLGFAGKFFKNPYFCPLFLMSYSNINIVRTAGQNQVYQRIFRLAAAAAP